MRKYIYSIIYVLCLLISCNQSKQKKEMDTIELSNGLSIKCQSLTKSEYEILLKESIGDSIHRLKERYGVDVHQLKNNKVIVKEEDYYTLYYSLDDLDKVLLDASGASQGSEILLNKNPYGKSFSDSTNMLIKELLSSLSLAYKDPDERVLKIIEDRVNSLPNAESYKKEHIMHFIAVVGEVLKKKYAASWDMILSSDGITWNPYMIIKGYQIQFFTYLYEDVFLGSSVHYSFLTEVCETIDEIVKYNLI